MREDAGTGYDVVILGAGCAGLSLCHYLLELGHPGRVLLLDRKHAFVDDRTWSFWDVEPTPFSRLAAARWDTWAVAAGGTTREQTSLAHPYLSLRSIDLYADCLHRFGADPRVEIVLGETVQGWEEHDGRVRVETDRATYYADRVIDARGLPPGSPELERLRKNSVWVPQHFRGLRIRADRPVFDPATCTLMDFSVSQDQGVHFLYLLPDSAEVCLVENVYFSFAEVDAATHEAQIRGYLWDTHGLAADEYRVEYEENGYIPMSDHQFSRARGSAAVVVGTLAGATRPSTGYAFLRIQRECRALAAELVLGAPSAPRRGEERRRLLDAVFLRFMVTHPRKLPAMYLRMFERVPAERLIRFLTENSTVADELRLALALPKRPFLKIVLRMFVQRVAHRGVRDAASHQPAVRAPGAGCWWSR